MDRLLDRACTGPLFLRMPGVAKMVMDAIYYRDQRTYHLHAFVVMPNHVHLLMTRLEAVSKVMESPKRFTAREGNRLLGLTGQPFWQDESWDRLVRNDTEFERIVYYIERNPVTAGLAATPEEFPWSSARPIDNRPQLAKTLTHPATCSCNLLLQSTKLASGMMTRSWYEVPSSSASALCRRPRSR